MLNSRLHRPSVENDSRDGRRVGSEDRNAEGGLQVHSRRGERRLERLPGREPPGARTFLPARLVARAPAEDPRAHEAASRLSRAARIRSARRAHARSATRSSAARASCATSSTGGPARSRPTSSSAATRSGWSRRARSTARSRTSWPATRAFFGRLEQNFFGRDVKIAKDKLHDHGSASMRYGRGAVLTVDLTNRCNMMCNPCFMDANQVGYVHELGWDDVQEILDNAVSIKPQRQMSVQFSGGEPTISPYFLEATRYAREIGYFSVQCATNGIRFAQEPEFAKAAYDGGPAARVPPVRRRRERAERAPRRREPLRREAPRARQPARGRDRRHARRRRS